MKRLAVIAMILTLSFIPYVILADDEAPPPEPGTYNTPTDDSGSDYLQSGNVDKKDTGEMLDAGTVTAKATKTPVPVVAPTTPPAPEPTAEPTARPTPRPKPIIKKITHRVVQPTPEPVRAQAQFPDIAISKAVILEVEGKKTAANFYGLLSMDRKYSLTLSMENKGTSTAMYTTAVLTSGHTSVLVSDPEKNLGTVMPGAKLDLVFPVVVLVSYDGDLKLPLTLKITANGIAKDFPVEAYIEEAVPYLLYIGAGLLILLIILMLILIFRNKKGGSKKGKDYDFNL